MEITDQVLMVSKRIESRPENYSPDRLDVKYNDILSKLAERPKPRKKTVWK